MLQLYFIGWAYYFGILNHREHSKHMSNRTFEERSRRSITRKDVLTELRDIAILAVLGFLMSWSGLSCNSCEFNTRLFWIITSFTCVMWIAMWKGNSYLADLISIWISWIEFPMLRFAVGLAVTILYTVGVMYLLAAIYANFSTVNFKSSMWPSVFITIIISLFMHGRSFLLNWKKSIIDAERLQKESIAAKYESLKSQINPHFLFNTLNVLTNVVYEDQDKAAKFIKQLSEVYRYVLDTRDKEIVPLEEELKFLSSYLYLQQIRFGDRLKLSIALDNVQSLVAPLALQMLIENAIKHNVVSEENPLHIRLYEEDNFIVIENNLQKKVVFAEDSTGIGLDNICKRYEFLDKRPVQIIQHEKFIVKLPMIPLKG